MRLQCKQLVQPDLKIKLENFQCSHYNVKEAFSS